MDICKSTGVGSSSVLNGRTPAADEGGLMRRQPPAAPQQVVDNVIDLTYDTDEETKAPAKRQRVLTGLEATEYAEKHMEQYMDKKADELPGRTKGIYNWHRGMQEIPFEAWLEHPEQYWLLKCPQGIISNDRVPGVLRDDVSVLKLPPSLWLDAHSWPTVRNAFQHGVKQFATLHPIEDKNHPLPPQLSRVVDVLDAASGASATHIIGRLQGAGREMALHADTAGRAYTCNLVWRQATDGTGGSVDFVHTSQPNIVYRIVFTQPSLYVMSDVGGGIMVEPAAHHWAHGVSTHELVAGHMLCALVTEYRAPVSFTAVVRHLSEQWASSSSCHQLSPVMLDKISAVPGQWPPSSKSITSKMLGKLGGEASAASPLGQALTSARAAMKKGLGVELDAVEKQALEHRVRAGQASAASSAGQAQVSSRAAKKLKEDRSPKEQKAIQDREAAGQGYRVQSAFTFEGHVYEQGHSLAVAEGKRIKAVMPHVQLEQTGGLKGGLTNRFDEKTGKWTKDKKREAGAKSSTTGTFICSIGVNCVAVHSKGKHACGTESDTMISNNTNGSGKAVGQPQKRCCRCKRTFSISYFTKDGKSLLDMWMSNQLSDK